MKPRTVLTAGGVLASLILLVFGAASIVIGLRGIQDVRDTLAEENIIGPEDSRIPGQLVDTGSEARAQADVIREHQLTSSGGLTYSEMGRYATPNGDAAGTNNAEEAAKDASGRPIANAARNQWVTATALSTSLNTAYFAEQVGIFAVVMGVALMLTGLGFGILTWGTLRHAQWAEKWAWAEREHTAPASASRQPGLASSRDA
ncbi:MAG: hypothetical protein IT303_11775 [Dehalococcoidia bacterium]|nr:hypothetical protein [Dehalococcoidia bacterium]